ncbi:TetR/AcrR family transcriptional regulator [Bradyrhizobium sp.]|uniref:TetR/AcrR family transcriptional regulator n=1 Tax=Bradyrhizobium sp. TaxID=376 RepID=UPI001DCB30AA|nr:TetR/AcrR family transcriptional regulator [Bradyrhizobium sp.]MBI5321419.1 TetR/AcrR family transcriptional regulator [Bradyrhizobium sp.]
MAAPPKHRGAIVRAAATLFRRNGYAATGINEIAEVAGAPKGSLYHYFPDGKDQIAEAAVRFAGKGVVATLEKLEQEHKTAAAMMQAYCRLVTGWMAKSGFRDGCPIATTLLESAPQSAGIALAGREAFAAWRAVIARALVRDGFSRAEARRLSTLAVSSLEGSLILARVERSGAPIEDVAKSLAVVLRSDVPARKRAAS